jgi:hypothetical protein
VDLTLRDGVNLQEAITSAKQIDEQSKVVGFFQEALDHVARQGYGNASFEVGGEEGLDIVEEFYVEHQEHNQFGPTELIEGEMTRGDAKMIKQSLRQSVRTVI